MNHLSYDPKSLRVMIVDDQDPIRKAMRRVLSAMGIKNVLECSDGSEALKESERQPFDLILLDLYMKKTSGFQVLETIRSRLVGHEVPVIVVTGESDKENIIKVSALGASDYIVKPFQMDAMVTKIQQVLNQYFSPIPVDGIMREATQAMQLRKYDEALNLYTQALKLEPESVKVRHNYALALYTVGRKEEAMGIFSTNATAFPSFYKTYQALSEIYFSTNKEEEALQVMIKELEFHPKQPSRQIIVGKLFLKNKDYESSIYHFREALKESPKDPVALLGMGQAFGEMGDIEKAIYYYKRLRRQTPKERKALRSMVNLCVASNKKPLAESILKEERKQHPDYLEIPMEMVCFYLVHEKSMEKSTEILNRIAIQALSRKTQTKEDLLLLGEGSKLVKDYIQGYLAYMKAYSLGAPKEKCLKHLEECLTKRKARFSSKS
jgi:two-component system chemotaxis response regulator CheY